jgi:hypothetical protein
MSRTGQTEGITAWLVTWDWADDAAAVSDAVAAILNSRVSQKQVAWFVEQIHALHTANAAELAAFARDPGSNPYRATVDNGRIYCGENPMVAALKVQELLVSTDADTRLEVISWTEVHAATDGSGGERRVKKQFRRRVAGPMTVLPVWSQDEGRFVPGWDNFRGIERG